jgi:hypothetical protein
MARSGASEQRDGRRRTDEVDVWLPRMVEGRPAVLARGLTARDADAGASADDIDMEAIDG